MFGWNPRLRRWVASSHTKGMREVFNDPDRGHQQNPPRYIVSFDVKAKVIPFCHIEVESNWNLWRWCRESIRRLLEITINNVWFIHTLHLDECLGLFRPLSPVIEGMIILVNLSNIRKSSRISYD